MKSPGAKLLEFYETGCREPQLQQSYEIEGQQKASRTSAYYADSRTYILERPTLS